MKSSVGAKIAVAVITLALGVYFWLTLRIAFGLFGEGADAVTVTMGVCLIVLPVLAAVFIVREIVFGVQGERLLRRMADEGSLPPDDLPKRPSGRPVREAADADFETWRQGVLDAPEDWRARVRLGLAYRASGDTKRARKAMREAIQLERAARGSSAG